MLPAVWHRTEPDIPALVEQKNYRGLIHALRHRNLAVQWQASRALAGLGTEGMDHLLSALRTRNKDIRLGIIEALGEIADPRSVEPLITLLENRDNEIRREAALALGAIGDPRAVGPLEELLRDPARSVRSGAAPPPDTMTVTPEGPGDAAYLAVR